VVVGASVSIEGSLVIGVTAGVALFVAPWVTGFLAFLLAFLLARALVYIVEGIMTGSVAGKVAGGAIGGAAGSAAGSVAGGAVVGATIGVVIGVMVSVVIGVGGLPLPLFLLACTGVGAVVSFRRGHWVGIIIAGAMAALGIRHLGAWATLAIPAVWLGYYRILPLYPLWATLSLLASGMVSWPNSLSFTTFAPIRGNKGRLPQSQKGRQVGGVPDAVGWLHRLPPYSDELVWLPLPGHDRLLAAVFQRNPDVGLDELRKMQASHSPGLRHTARRALPRIVAEQLVSASDLTMLLNTARVSHPYLPALVPALYSPGEENFAKPTPVAVEALRRVQPEIAQLLPRFQDIARSVAAALESQSAVLRERGLERALNELRLLQGQLPGMNLGPHAVERWRPVLERWQALLQAEMERQRSEAVREIVNPFQFGNPLSRERAYLFKGRTAFAEQIVRLVLDRSRPTLVLHGPRRCGKSSFLLNLPRLLPADIVSVYMDLQSAAATESEADFCYSLARAMYWDGQAQGVELPLPRRDDFRTRPYPALEDWLDAALPRLGRCRLLISLDEFEKLGAALFQGRLSERLLDQLRHLIQHYEPLGFLFSGVQTLEELGPRWHSYFISVVPIEMLYLEPNEARELLTDPDPEFDMEYEEGIVEEIVALTRGQPYLLQLIGSSLVKHANINRTRRVNARLLEEAIASAFREGRPYFTNLYEEYTGATPAQVEAGRALLIALAQGRPITASSEEAQAALRRMVRYHILERVGESYRFEIPLVERWVREYAARGI